MNIMQPLNTRPVPAEKQALRDIAEAFIRKDFTVAKSYIPAALGKNWTNLDGLRDVLRTPGLNLTELQKLDFMLAVIPHADRVVKETLGDDCFDPSNESVYGHFWGIIGTRPYMRVVLDVSTYSAICEEWEQALEYTQKAMMLNCGDNNGVRVRVPAYLINLGRPMEALNYCIEWIDEEGTKNNPSNAPIGGFGNLFRYKKEELSPESPQTFGSQFGDAGMTYNAAIASFLVYGACPYSLSWLRDGYSLNKHIAALILNDPSTYPTTLDFEPRMMGSSAEANDYIVFCGSMWKNSLEAREWLKTCAEEIAKKKCDGLGCEKREERLKEFKLCGGCKEKYYCGVECQTKDWKEGNHKARCKKDREYAAGVKAMGRLGGGLRD